MSFYNVLAVGIGGFLGSIARYASATFLEKKISSGFPYPILAVNIVGSFLLGAFLGYCLQTNKSDSFRLLLTTGFCGGFTTFSTFAMENVNLIQNKMTGAALTYILLSVGGCIAAAFAGFIFSKSVF